MRRHLALLTTGALAFGTLVAAVPATAPAASDGGPHHLPGTYEGVSQPIYAEYIDENLAVETSYGVLRGDLRRPVVPDGVEVPIILVVTPYQVLYKSLNPGGATRVDYFANADFFVPRGYAFAVFDAVGTYGSEGCTDFGGLGERRSTAELVDWLGERDWSNGKVGMIGASYDGTLAIAAAVEAPEHLATIVPQVAIDRWYDYMFNQGVRMGLEDNLGGLLDPPIDSPADYDTVYGVVPPYHRLSDDPEGSASALAAHVQPCNRVENQTRGYQTDPVYDDFWIERDYRDLASNVRASVLFEGAWLDDNVKHWAATRFIEALPDELPKHLAIGQWSHSVSQFADAGRLRHAWFDHFLVGLDVGFTDPETGEWLVPLVDSQASDRGRRYSYEWPPAGTEEVEFRIVDGAAAAGDELGLDGAAPTWTDTNPGLLEPQVSREGCTVECIRAVSQPVTTTTRIVGAPRLEFRGSTDLVSTHLTPVLWEVSSSGARTPITRGLLNSRNRDGLDTSELLDPLSTWEATVELWDIDHVLRPGDRLELTLSSTNATFGVADETRATTSLDLDGTRLLLPLR
ncbi:MAG: CocE/NonD family hydrolase [Actinobacteria bacterium]|nr:CocE/NonD family hydrolase [Actinomycetota bacterium]